MGEPAALTDAQRAETLAFANKVVEDVRNDEDTPLRMPPMGRGAMRGRYTWSAEEIAEVKKWVDEADRRIFQLAQELLDTRAALDKACEALEGNYTENEAGELADRLRKLDLTPLDDPHDA